MKTTRQKKILELIEENEIETQAELKELLNQNGFEVKQPTVSRDIRELGLIKTHGKGGRFKYTAAVGSVSKRDDPIQTHSYIRVFREGFISADTAMNMLVIKTAPGMAMAVAACVDAMDIDRIVGSIAGDDTIMCAVRTVADAKDICNRLNELAFEDLRKQSR